jgi:hypothetical protein
VATSHPVFQLRVNLEDTEPEVWRRLLVPGSLRLDTLHLVLQAAMGWTDSHMHRFDVEGTAYGMTTDDWGEDDGASDESDSTVADVLHGHPAALYEYDFGDSWRHSVNVEKEWAVPLALKHAVCLGGENACPPEDVGGVPGYAEFLSAIADPRHEEHDALLEWAGGAFDPLAFDLAAVNAALQRIR